LGINNEQPVATQKPASAIRSVDFMASSPRGRCDPGLVRAYPTAPVCLIPTRLAHSRRRRLTCSRSFGRRNTGLDLPDKLSKSCAIFFPSFEKLHSKFVIPRPTDNAGFNGYRGKIVGQHQLDFEIGLTRHLNQRRDATTGTRQVHDRPVALYHIRSRERASEMNLQSESPASLHQTKSHIMVEHRYDWLAHQSLR